jgi:FixJ family two-component response regulator
LPRKAALQKASIISIIDDDESFREAIRRLVRSLGYQADAFQSAEDFLQSEVLDATSCVITDIQMPGLSGLDLQDRLRDDGRETPVIFITAYPEGRARARAMKAGAIGCLGKPFDDEALIACLDKALTEDRGRG